MGKPTYFPDACYGSKSIVCHIIALGIVNKVNPLIALSGHVPSFETRQRRYKKGHTFPFGPSTSQVVTTIARE